MILEKMETNETQAALASCLNCSTVVKAEDVYCAHCGQRTRESRISIWILISEFFGSIFNIDSRFFKSLRHIIFPSRLPREYMQGKRRSYVNPSRFFFVTLVIHFAALAFITKDISIESDIEHEEITEWQNLERSILAEKFDSLTSVYPFDNQENQDSVRNILFGSVKNPKLDSTDFMDFEFGEVNFGKKISNYDILVLEPDELVDNYEVEGFWLRQSFRQMHKFRKEPSAAFQFFVGNGLWVIVLITLFSAFFLKLLYIRRKYFLVDHLVVSMYFHSVVLLILSLVYGLDLIIWKQSEGLTNLSGILLIIIPVYGFFTLKRYYMQGYRKTFLKFGLLAMYEFIMLSIFATIVFLVSALLF